LNSGYPYPIRLPPDPQETMVLIRTANNANANAVACENIRKKIQPSVDSKPAVAKSTKV
jgi:hypothetical protein